MTARSTHLVLVPGLACTEDLFAEQIASLRGEVAISIADHTRHDTINAIARAILATAPNRFGGRWRVAANVRTSGAPPRAQQRRSPSCSRNWPRAHHHRADWRVDSTCPVIGHPPRQRMSHDPAPSRTRSLPPGPCHGARGTFRRRGSSARGCAIWRRDLPVVRV
jgi:hypothetical protein